MGKYRVLVIFSIFIFSTYQSNSQTVFPLAIGNTWQYEIKFYFYDPPIPSRTMTFSLVSDTLMSNGKTYFQIYPFDMFDQNFIRSDSSCVYYWDRFLEKEIIAIDITLPLDSTLIIGWNDYFTLDLEAFYQTELFGKQCTNYKFLYGGLLFADVTFSDEFGFVAYEYRGDTEAVELWLLKGCNINDTLYGTITDVQSTSKTPTDFVLHQNYPNPFNPSTKIKFEIPKIDSRKSETVKLTVFDILGKEITTLINEEKVAGIHEVEFDARVPNGQGSKLASGVYFYRLQVGNYSEIKKMVWLK
jgi:hypothetical protein